MGILNDALNIQDAKRSQRLLQTARKAKIEANKIKEGTYRGIDLVDGTAKVQLDDQPTATSGYRLITNAPLGDGDRVSIRPNGVGLPRADAKNVALKLPMQKQEQKEIKTTFVSVLIFPSLTIFLGSPLEVGLGSPVSSSIPGITWKYKNLEIVSPADNGTFTLNPLYEDAGSEGEITGGTSEVQTFAFESRYSGLIDIGTIVEEFSITGNANVSQTTIVTNSNGEFIKEILTNLPFTVTVSLTATIGANSITNSVSLTNENPSADLFPEGSYENIDLVQYSITASFANS